MKTTINFIGKAAGYVIVKPIKWYFKTAAKNYEEAYGKDAWKYMRWM